MIHWFYNLKTAAKLTIGFGFCLTIAVTVAMVAILRMDEMNRISNDIVAESLHGSEALGRFEAASERFRASELNYILATTSNSKSKAIAELSSQHNIGNQALLDYGSTIANPKDRQNWHNLLFSWETYEPTADDVQQLSRSNTVSHATGLVLGSFQDKFDRLRDNTQTMVAWNKERGEEYNNAANSAYASARIVIAGLIVLALLIGGLLGIAISRYISSALSQVSLRMETLNKICITNLGIAVEALEHGDLTVPIQTGSTPLTLKSSDEFGRMAITFNAMLERLQMTIASFRKSQHALCSMLEQLQSASGQVDAAANSLVGTSQQISAGTEEVTSTMHEIAISSEQSARAACEVAKGSSVQAKSITEGAELVKQLAASVHMVASDSEKTGLAAKEANAAAQKGADSVRDTVTGMHEISKTITSSAEVIQTLGASSKQIGTIVQTIEAIADQTNLLALNAAIEAARAGGAGRGFAVVADEVRKLAERSRFATKEIGDLIKNVQSQTHLAVAAMEGGVKSVAANTVNAERAGEALNQILDVVSSVTNRVQNICTAAEQMKLSSDNVTRAMADVAAIVEESSASAEEMSSSADEVSASVNSVAGTTAEQSKAIDSLVSSAADLSDVSSTLSDLIARFKIENDSKPQLRLSETPNSPSLRLA
jgi:methyl-accepting chemotaxis protein